MQYIADGLYKFVTEENPSIEYVSYIANFANMYFLHFEMQEFLNENSKNDLSNSLVDGSTTETKND